MNHHPVEVVTIGESMGLFHAPAGLPIESHPTFRVSFGGAESNVAIGLARLGRGVEWIGRLGDDDLGRLTGSFDRVAHFLNAFEWDARVSAAVQAEHGSLKITGDIDRMLWMQGICFSDQAAIPGNTGLEMRIVS